MDIGPITNKFGIEFTEVKRLSHAVGERVFFIDNKYILKGRNQDLSTEEDFTKEVSLLENVRSTLPFEVPKPMRTSDGNLYYGEEDFWIMYEVLEGKPMCSWKEYRALKKKDMKKLVKALRELHDDTMGKFPLTDKSYFTDNINRNYDLTKEFLSESARVRIENALNNVKSFQISQEDACFVHGGFRPENILVSQKKITGLLYPDHSRIGFFMEDLAFTTMVLLRNYEKEFKFNKRLYKKILKWYGLKANKELFQDYFVLCILNDIQFFNESDLSDKQKYIDYQVKYLEVCSKE